MRAITPPVNINAYASNRRAKVIGANVVTSVGVSFGKSTLRRATTATGPPSHKSPYPLMTGICESAVAAAKPRRAAGTSQKHSDGLNDDDIRAFQLSSGVKGNWRKRSSALAAYGRCCSPCLGLPNGYPVIRRASSSPVVPSGSSSLSTYPAPSLLRVFFSCFVSRPRGPSA